MLTTNQKNMTLPELLRSLGVGGAGQSELCVAIEHALRLRDDEVEEEKQDERYALQKALAQFEEELCNAFEMIGNRKTPLKRSLTILSQLIASVEEMQK